MHAHSNGRRFARSATGRVAGTVAALVTAIAMLALAASNAAAVPPPPGSEFGISSFETKALDADGNDETRAGAHPHSARADFELNAYDDGIRLGGELSPVENMRRVTTKLPQGFVGDPRVAGRCPLPLVGAETRAAYPTKCPTDTWVGHIQLATSGVDVSQPIASVEPERGYPAEFAFSEFGLTYPLYPELRSDSDYGIDVIVPAANYNRITGVSVTFCSWGVVQTHQGFLLGSSTFRCLDEGEPGAFEKPFLTNPSTECPSTAPFTDLVMDSWEHPGVFVDARAESPLITDCDTLEFEPEVSIEPTTAVADAPTGLDVDMAFPQEDNAQGQAPPALKKAVVRLPEGMGINAAAADGLSACSDDDLKLRSKAPVTCPESSKIGTVTAVSPLLDDPVEGEVFIRSQNSQDPGSGEMFRLALTLEDADRGISVRLPGQVRVDAATGRIETAFDNNPELPVSSIQLELKDGPRAPLAMPAECGPKTIDTELTSWGGQTATSQSTFDVACSDGLGGFAPGFKVGVVSPIAGTFSPFSLALSRDDRSQELRSIQQIKTPEGLLGRVAGVPLCAEADAERGACGEGSRIGHVQIAAGAGSNPLWVPQQSKAPTAVYLTGPYRGAPYGLSIVVPAQAGPFDLGTAVVRSALHVDPSTAQLTTGVDETRLYDANGNLDQVVEGAMPRVVKGVQLRQREIHLSVDRKDFIVNPTDCDAQQTTATISGYGNATAAVASRFQVGGCAALPFKPRLGLALTGKKQMRTGRHPGVRAQVRQTGLGEAGIEKAVVTLPPSLALDPDNAQALCEFVDGTKPDLEKHCPAGSIVGKARARTPLLERDLTGNVYFVKNVRRDTKTGNEIRTLPMIVVALRGEISVNLKGESSTTKSGRLVNTFASVPDAPITEFDLNIAGGSNGILAVTRTKKARINVCAKPKSHIAAADFDGQNGKVSDRNVRFKTPCPAKPKKGKPAKRKAQAKRKAARG
jgi:hypothetical protein